MNIAAKKQDIIADAGVFVPDDGDKYEWQEGQRRKVEAIDALPLRWPTTPKERFDLFDAWHGVAMQILHRGRGSFRLMSVAKIVIRWSQGVIIDTNEELAQRAGNCNEKTIKRDVSDHIRRGLFVAKYDWIRPGGGKFKTVRELRPALPIVLPEGIILPESVPLSRDTSGPALELLSRDTSGPGGRDISGPATIDHKKGDGDAA